MRKLVFLLALGSAVVLTYGRAFADHTGGASISPCCDAVPCTGTGGACTNLDGGWACNEDGVNAFPATPDGSGCQESANGCIAGNAGAGGVLGCVCVGATCVSGPVPPAVPPVIGMDAAACRANAVHGCRASVPSAAHCTVDGPDLDTLLDDCAP